MELSKLFKVKASSLTESIIAMVIIAICLSTAIIIYINILNADKNLPFYMAEQKVKKLLVQTINDDLFHDEDFSYETYTIVKTVENFEQLENTYKVVFKINAAGKTDNYSYVITK
jgi:hypothetical protein